MAASAEQQKEEDALTWFIPALVLILVFGMAARAPLDSDLWWHLRGGEASLELGRPVLSDLFSHTRFGETWTNHSWLAQVILFAFYRFGGYLGLAGLVAALAAASLGLVYLQMEGHPLSRAFILILAATVIAPVWSPRPQIFSLLLFSCLGYLLHRYRVQGRDQLWLSLPLFILWSNLHGGHVLGLLLIAAAIAGEAFDWAFRFSRPAGESRKIITHLALWGVAGWLALVINPNGLAIWTIPFRTIGVGALQELIAEWASPDFHQIAQQPFLWLLFLTLGALALSQRRLAGPDLFAVLGFAYLGFLARRNFGPFALVAAPVLSRHLGDLLTVMKERLASWTAGWREAWRRDAPGASWFPLPARLRNSLNISILAILGAIALVKLVLVASSPLLDGHIREVYPQAAAGWIEANRPLGPIFNDYNWGGYLVWNLRDYPVFVDGRTDLFDDDLLETYLLTFRGEPGWQGVLDDHRVNLVLVPFEAGIVRELERSYGWQEAYRDRVAVVYVRRSSLTP
jgi:hypothetical protein